MGCCDDNIELGSPGANGANGISSYTYIAFADNVVSGAPDVVTNFSLGTPDPTSEWLAIITSSIPIASPVEADFEDAWVKIRGDDGVGAAGIELSLNGVSEVTGVDNINFIPAGFTGMSILDAGGGQADVTIVTAALIEVTRTEALNLISLKALIPGASYLITDRGDDGVVLRAISSNVLSLDGQYNAVVPDYLNVSGDYDSIWYPDMGLPSAGKLYAYNNKMWENLTGAVGTAPSGDGVNWDEIAFSDIRYVREVDFCHYDINNDFFIYRKDKRNNSFYQSYDDFISYDNNTYLRWGDDTCVNNVINGGVFDFVNIPGIVKDNTSINSIFVSNSFPVNCEITNNYLLNNISITDNIFSQLLNNVVTNSTISSNGTSGIPIDLFYNNTIANSTVSTITKTSNNNTLSIQDNVIMNSVVTDIDCDTASSAINIQLNVFKNSVFSIILLRNGCTSITILTLISASLTSVRFNVDVYKSYITNSLIAGSSGIIIFNNQFQHIVCDGITSNITMELDLDDPSIYSGTVLEIPIDYFSFVGNYILKSSTTPVIITAYRTPTGSEAEIDLAPTCRFYPEDGLTATFTTTAIGAATAFKFVGDTASYTLIGRYESSMNAHFASDYIECNYLNLLGITLLRITNTSILI